MNNAAQEVRSLIRERTSKSLPKSVLRSTDTEGTERAAHIRSQMNRRALVIGIFWYRIPAHPASVERVSGLCTATPPAGLVARKTYACPA